MSAHSVAIASTVRRLMLQLNEDAADVLEHIGTRYFERSHKGGWALFERQQLDGGEFAHQEGAAGISILVSGTSGSLSWPCDYWITDVYMRKASMCPLPSNCLMEPSVKNEEAWCP